MRLKFSLRELLLVLAIAALGMGWWIDHRRLELFMTAVDPTSPIEFRADAASRLSEEELGQMRSQMLAQLPGNWDLSGTDAIELLGRFGDADSLQELKRLQTAFTGNTWEFNVPGKFPPKIEWSISEILKRLDENDRVH